MDVETPTGRTRSGGRILAYSTTALLLTATIHLPATLSPAYASGLATLLLAGLLGVAIRAGLDGIVALRRPSSPPHVPVDDLPTVSVVVTAYNEADVLPETIAACRDLDYPGEKLEVLVCYEAASWDGTARVAERAAETDQRITAVEHDESPAGKAAITNFGLERATGAIVCVIDADQRFRPDAVRRAVRWFRSDESIECVTGRRVGTNPEDSLVALHAMVEHHVAERLAFVARDRLDGFALFTGGQAFFRARLFDDLGPFDESVLLEDVEMACRIYESGGTIRVDPGVVSRERNPTTLRAWWHQRKRWARGGMQVARRHLRRLAAAPTPLRVRVDGVATLGGVVAIPLLVLAGPAVALAASTDSAATYLPLETALVGLVLATPTMLALAVFLVDRGTGIDHARREYLAALTLAPYLAVQALAVLVAFLDEFVLGTRSVYVTSTEVEE